MSIENQGIITRSRNTARVDFPSSTYSFVYGRHDKPHSLNEFPADFDALLLEVGGKGNYFLSPWKTIANLSEQPDNINALSIASSREKPVFLVDPYTESKFSVLLSVGLSATEVSLSMLHQDMLPNTDLINYSINILVRSWLLQPAVLMATGYFADKTQTGYGFYAFFNKLNRLIHPEYMGVLVHPRNTLIAHKERWLNEYLGNDKHLLSILGSGHTQTENELNKSPRQRLSYLRRTKFFWGKSFNPECVYSIQRYDFRRGEWEPTETLEVPDLKTLIKHN